MAKGRMLDRDNRLSGKRSRFCGKPLTRESLERRSRLYRSERKIKEAEARQDLYAKLDPEVRELAIREFAKLGLI